MEGYQAEILFFALFIPHMLFALSVHEAAHAYSAYLLGDDTAALMGRVTLNPFRHLDPLGLVAFFIIKFGWAKPVPVNPLRFRNPRRDDLVVSLAGPASNLATGILLLGLILLFHGKTGKGNELVNGLVAFFFIGAQLNIGLCFFNLIPVPPLDGSHILMSLLPERARASAGPLMSQGAFLLLILIMASAVLRIPVFDYLVWKPMFLVMKGVVGPEALMDAISAKRLFLSS